MASLAAALVAFNPQFLFLSAAVNNDAAVIACCAAGVWLLLRIVTRPAPATWQLIALGAILGLAALSKLSGLALAGLAVVVLSVLAWRRRSARELIRQGLIVAGAALLVGGWWYGRNLVLYGDPLGLQAMFDILPRRASAPTLAELWDRAEGVWRSCWAVFGTFNVVPDDWIYIVYSLLTLLGVLGLLVVGPARRTWRRRRGEAYHSATAMQRGQLALLAFWVAVLVVSLIVWAQMRYPQGRLLFPALSAGAVLLAAGLVNWAPARGRRAWAWLLSASLLALAMAAPWLWIAPAFAAPSLLPADAVVPNPISVEYGDRVELVGYRMGNNDVQPGGTLEVDLYWRAKSAIDADYSVFIHLTDEYGIIQAQRDSYPADGLLATGDWPTGAIIPDRHLVSVPDTAAAPARLRLDVGLYEYESATRLPTADGDCATVGYVSLSPTSGGSDLSNSVFVNFDDQIALTGFSLSRRTMQAGEAVEVIFQWEALMIPKGDYVVFSHLVYPPDVVWAQMDAVPADGMAPTSQWVAGQQIEDHHVLELPAEAPAGDYFIEIGIYDPQTMDRLPVEYSDKGIVLGQVAVTIGQ